MKNIFTEEVELTEEQLAEISGGCDGSCEFGDDYQEAGPQDSYNSNVSQQSENQGGLLGLGLLNNVNHVLL
jgi:bacteriocin-like protein